jgi:hypothetical protein
MRARAICTAVLIGFLVAVASPVLGDGLFYNLPKDGTSATYELMVEGVLAQKSPEGTTKKEATMAALGTLRMASVGQVVEDKQPCRWIEVELKMATRDSHGEGKDPVEVYDVYKVLVPEKYLVKGENPLDHAIRAWKSESRGHQSSPLRIAEMKSPQDIDESPLPVMLSDAFDDTKHLGKAEVESKLGKRTCEGVAGSMQFKAKGTRVMKFNLENRLHADAPFGIVESKWKMEEGGPGAITGSTMEWTLKLAGIGDNAKSELPDSK